MFVGKDFDFEIFLDDFLKILFLNVDIVCKVRKLFVIIRRFYIKWIYFLDEN